MFNLSINEDNSLTSQNGRSDPKAEGKSRVREERKEVEATESKGDSKGSTAR